MEIQAKGGMGTVGTPGGGEGAEGRDLGRNGEEGCWEGVVSRGKGKNGLPSLAEKENSHSGAIICLPAQVLVTAVSTEPPSHPPDTTGPLAFPDRFSVLSLHLP